MTGFLLSFGWNWLLIPAAIWFANGLRKALLNPRIKYVSHTPAAKHGKLVTLRRQELLPPWRLLDETWLVDEDRAIRDGDGQTVFPPGRYDAFTLPSEMLFLKMRGQLRMIAARDAETEELSK